MSIQSEKDKRRLLQLHAMLLDARIPPDGFYWVGNNQINFSHCLVWQLADGSTFVYADSFSASATVLIPDEETRLAFFEHWDLQKQLTLI